jgi:predicted DNA-binding transcriptional regulator AlpA
MSNNEIKQEIFLARDILKMLGVSKSTLKRWIVEGFFPHPVKLGKRLNAWHRHELESFLRGSKHD